MTPSAAPSLVVAEAFGPTIQGEGPSTGRRASFVRLGGCNLHCSWCDTAYTWDARRYDLRAELRREQVSSLIANVATHRTDLVVITGGEPLLHQDQPGWSPLLEGLCGLGARLEVETNGTIRPSIDTIRLISRFNVSPKLAHSGDEEHQRIRPDVLTALLETGKATFKFVVRGIQELDDVVALIAAVGIPGSDVWIMPEGTSPEAILDRQRVLADATIERGFNITTRLHVLLWFSERNR